MNRRGFMGRALGAILAGPAAAEKVIKDVGGMPVTPPLPTATPPGLKFSRIKTKKRLIESFKDFFNDEEREHAVCMSDVRMQSSWDGYHPVIGGMKSWSPATKYNVQRRYLYMNEIQRAERRYEKRRRKAGGPFMKEEPDID